MGARRIRREQRRVDMAESRHRNGIRKSKERVRRDAYMLDTVKNSTPPFGPAVMSWLSVQLKKPSKQITPDDIQKLVAPKKSDSES
jgi:hypothetical protein